MTKLRIASYHMNENIH